MADESTILDSLVNQVEDESLRARIAREIELLRGSRRFGLVYDRHLPESVRLVDHPIRKGVRVGLRDESSDETWFVAGFTDVSRQVAILSGAAERSVEELVVIREFGEPVYPGLESVERVQNGSDDAPWHTVINGENFHALQALRSTHRGKVDVIYIDPPYNTGNEGWIYNDRYVDSADRAKSSKWLSFLERRLLIARDLLKPTGVIIAAIGDDEHHRFRMLLDQTFRDENFLANITWQGNTSALAKHTGGGVDYMLVYARDRQRHIESVGQWRMPKDGAEEVLAIGRVCWEESGHDPEVATENLRKWWRKNKARFDSSLPVYDRIDLTGRVFFGGPLGNTLLRPNLQYDLPHPVTGKPVRMPPNGWAHSKERMAANVEAGRIIFGPDHTTTATYKQYLDEFATQTPLPTFRKDRRSSTLHLQKVLGEKRFPFPKDHDVIKQWINITTASDPGAVILDFFGGSGTTSEAVMRLNDEDGGSRQSILVTNNEVGAVAARDLRKSGHHPGDVEWEAMGVFEYVCRPRISTVVTGTRPDGSAYSEGLAANVEFFNLTYLDPGRVRRGREYTAVAPLMWLEGGARGARIDTIPDEGWALTESYGVLFTLDVLAGFADAVAEAATDGRAPAVIFVVTDSPAEYQQACRRLPAGIETVRLYQDYLSNYTINIAGGVR